MMFSCGRSKLAILFFTFIYHNTLCISLTNSLFTSVIINNIQCFNSKTALIIAVHEFICPEFNTGFKFSHAFFMRPLGDAS